MVISRVGEIELRVTQGAAGLACVLAALAAARLGGWQGLFGAGLILISLLLHELGHLAVAQALGVPVKAIGLCWKGAYLQRSESRRAAAELLISIAGPMANALLYVLLRGGPVVSRWVAMLNLVLLFSNLIPISGTDGARIRDSLLALRKKAEVSHPKELPHP